MAALSEEHRRLVTGFGEVDVVVRRSARRKRTLTARVEDGSVVVLAPVRRSSDEDALLIRLAERVLARRANGGQTAGEQWLPRRAERLIRLYFPGLEPPSSVTWVTNQSTRWGSASIGTRTIRLSHHLAAMPDWVIDSVLVHELAHLIEPNHGPRFHALCARYERTGDAKLFLQGVEFGRRLSQEGHDDGAGHGSGEQLQLSPPAGRSPAP